VAAVRAGLFAALSPAQTQALEDVLTAVLDRLDPDATLRMTGAGCAGKPPRRDGVGNQR
jgi:hypothetical protein